MSAPRKLITVANAIVAARIARPDLVPFGSGVAPGDDRRSFLNASEMGRCSRQLWYERSSTPRDVEDRPGIFDRGHAGEAWAVAFLGAAGLGELLYTGKDQARLIDGKNRIAGTPDGLLVHEGESAVEIKTYGSTVDRSLSPATANVAQAELCIELFHRLTPHRPADALLIYLKAEDFTTIHAYRIPRRPAVWMEAVGKAKDVLDAKDARDVMPSPSALCGLCPFRASCAAVQVSALPLGERLPKEKVDQLDAAVASYLAARDATKRADRAEINAKRKLKDTLRGLDLRKATRPGYSVSLTEEPAIAQLDETALEAVLGDLEPYRRRGLPTERLEVRGR